MLLCSKLTCEVSAFECKQYNKSFLFLFFFFIHPLIHLQLLLYVGQGCDTSRAYPRNTGHKVDMHLGQEAIKHAYSKNSSHLGEIRVVNPVFGRWKETREPQRTCKIQGSNPSSGSNYGATLCTTLPSLCVVLITSLAGIQLNAFSYLLKKCTFIFNQTAVKYAHATKKKKATQKQCKFFIAVDVMRFLQYFYFF